MNKATSIMFFMILINVCSAQEIENLFYCNDNLHIRGIHLLNDKFAIGYSDDLRKVYLLNDENLMIDTLQLGDNNTFQSVHVLSNKKASISFLNKVCIYGFSGQGFELQSEVQLNFNKFPFFGSMLIDKNRHIGWKRYKAKGRKKLDYKYVYYDNGKIYDITNDLNVKSKFNGSRQLKNNYIFNIKTKEIYIPIERASVVCIFNTSSKQSKYFSFPANDYKKESWYYYYDLITNKHYAVLFNKSGVNKLYGILNNFEDLKFIRDLDFIPRGISNNKLYKVRKQYNEKNDPITCHYLVPIYEQNGDPTILEEINIKDN